MYLNKIKTTISFFLILSVISVLINPGEIIETLTLYSVIPNCRFTRRSEPLLEFFSHYHHLDF